MKKILSLFLAATLMLSLLAPAAVYAAVSTTEVVLYENNLEKYSVGTTGDTTSADVADGLVISSGDKGTGKFSITTDQTQGKVLQVGPAKTSYDSGFSFKGAPAENNKPVLSFKLKPVSTGSATWCYPGLIDVFGSATVDGVEKLVRICRMHLYWGSNGGTSLNTQLCFRNQTSSVYQDTYYVAMGFSDGTPGWMDVKLEFDHTSQTYSVYVNGEEKATGQNYYSAFNHTNIAQVMLYSSETQGYFLIDDVKVSAEVPTQLVSSVPAGGAGNAELTDTLSLTYNKSNLVVDDAVLTITPEEGSAVTINNAASVDSVDKKKIHFDLSAADFEMEYETKYTVLVSGIKDTSDNDVSNATFSFTTREPRLIVGEPEFSNGVGSVVITNERPDDPLAAAVIFAAFDGNELKDIAMHPDTVSGGGELTFTKTLEYNSAYTYKAFIWDSLTGMHPIGSYEEADNVTADVGIDYLSGEGAITGSLKKGSCATAIVLHPRRELSEVVADGSNIKDIVAYIGAAECDDDGSYNMDFALNLGDSANGQEITVLSSGNGITTPEENTFIYYNKGTVTGIFDAITKAADGAAIVDLLSGQTLVNGVNVNAILKLDKTDYDTLTDKAAACKNLIGMNFTDIESVHTAFKAAVELQKALENAPSGFTPVYYDFSPVNGVVNPGWGNIESTGVSVAEVKPCCANDDENSAFCDPNGNHFYRFTFNGEGLANSAEWRAGITFEKAIPYNDTPKVISYKLRIDGNSINTHQMEMLDSSLGRASKEFVLKTRGETLYGQTVSTDEWHTVEIVMDGTGRLDKESNSAPKHKKYIFLDGELIDTVEIGTDNGVKTTSFDIKRIQMYASIATNENSTLDFDDLRIEEYRAPEIIGSTPENGAEDVDITNKIKVVFDKAITGVTADNFELYGGDGSAEASGVAQSMDKKTVTFTLNDDLDYNTSYKVVISGLKDSFGEDVTPYIFEFVTRKKDVVTGEPTYSSVAGGTDCTVTIENEDSTPKAATVIFASFDGDEMTKAEMATNDGFTGEWTPTVNLTEGDDSKIKMFAWNSLAGMQPLALHPSVNSAEANVQIDYKTGKGKVTGTLSPKTPGAVATVLVLKPGKTTGDSDPIAYIGEVECDENGSFSTDFVMNFSRTDTDEKKEVKVYVGAKGITTRADDSFVCYSTDVADSVLSAVKNAADGNSIAAMLAGTTLVDGVKANDVLHLNTAAGSDYENLKDKAAACAGLKGVTFTNIGEVWTAFDAAVAAQKAYEAEVDAAISDLNTITYDKMEEKLGIYKSLLKPNLQLSEGTYYSQLNSDQKTTLYKQLANSYTFVFGADINKDIEGFAKDILDPTTPSVGDDDPGSGGGGGGGGGNRGNNDTEMTLSGIPVSPSMPATAFIDTGSVSWAQESIAYLAQRNIINGIGNNRFAPNDFVTREQIVKIMVLAGEIELTADTASFSDVTDDAWFAPYVAAGVKSGIVAGYGDGSFGSGKNVTRQDLAVFLIRLAELMGKELPTDKDGEPYKDNTDISDYALSAVYTLRSAGIMNGMGDGSFVPRESVTRAMAAKAVYELLQYGK